MAEKNASKAKSRYQRKYEKQVPLVSRFAVGDYVVVETHPLMASAADRISHEGLQSSCRAAQDRTRLSVFDPSKPGPNKVVPGTPRQSTDYTTWQKKKGRRWKSCPAQGRTLIPNLQVRRQSKRRGTQRPRRGLYDTINDVRGRNILLNDTTIDPETTRSNEQLTSPTISGESTG